MHVCVKYIKTHLLRIGVTLVEIRVTKHSTPAHFGVDTWVVFSLDTWSK